jgi:NFU1 iron-sulfur cluster scaffold homolog, mitochondrial
MDRRCGTVILRSPEVQAAKGLMLLGVLEIQPTPNPNAAKFILDRPVSDQPTSFFNAASAVGHSLATRLFEVPGVSSVLLLGDFVTVNKSPDAAWAPIVERVQQILNAEA